MQLVLIEAGIISLPDEFAADLLIRPAHFDIYRLGFYRAAIGIAQQAVEQHGFAGTVKVTRAKHEELQRMSDGAGDIKLGQVQCRSVQA